jgi:hypothetical protein
MVDPQQEAEHISISQRGDAAWAFALPNSDKNPGLEIGNDSEFNRLFTTDLFGRAAAAAW